MAGMWDFRQHFRCLIIILFPSWTFPLRDICLQKFRRRAEKLWTSLCVDYSSEQQLVSFVLTRMTTFVIDSDKKIRRSSWSTTESIQYGPSGSGQCSRWKNGQELESQEVACFSYWQEGYLSQDKRCPVRGQACRKCATIGYFRLKCPQLYQQGGAQSGFKGTRNSRDTGGFG